MDKWKDIDAFIDWSIDEKNKAIKFKHYYIPFDNNVWDNPISKINIARSNSEVDIDYLTVIIDNKILDHLNVYFLDQNIELFIFELFILTVEEVNFFLKSKRSADAKDFKAEILSLKKKANELQFYANDQIVLRLPVLPQITIYSMRERFEGYGLSYSIIKDFHSYFIDIPGQTKLPTKKNAYVERMKEFDTNWHEYDDPVNKDLLKSTGLDKYISMGLTEEAITSFVGMAEAEEKLHIYKPNIKFKYDNHKD